jgi:hypothetical protein
MPDPSAKPNSALSAIQSRTVLRGCRERRPAARPSMNVALTGSPAAPAVGAYCHR